MDDLIIKVQKLEGRVQQLEAELISLRQQVAPAKKGNWLEQISGSMKDNPAFPEMLQILREMREAELAAMDAQP